MKEIVRFCLVVTEKLEKKFAQKKEEGSSDWIELGTIPNIFETLRPSLSRLLCSFRHLCFTWFGTGAFRAGWQKLIALPWHRASHVTVVVKNLPANARDLTNVGLIPGLGRSPGREHENPLQYSCLENPIDRGAGGLQSVDRTESDTTEATKHALPWYLLYERPSVKNCCSSGLSKCFL